jgi:hypothetical protein
MYNYKICYVFKEEIDLKFTSSTGSKTRFSIGLLVVDLFLVALVVGCSNSGHDSAFGSIQGLPTPKPVLETDFLTYDDAITGFSIKYPSDWQLAQRIDKSVTFIAPRDGTADIFPAGLAIIVKEVPANLSLSRITQIQLNTLKSLYPDISIVETSDIVFASHPAHKIIFTATDNTNHLRKAMQIWFKEDTKSYLITYKAEVESFPRYLSTIEKMLNSFYIIGKSPNLS